LVSRRTLALVVALMAGGCEQPIDDGYDESSLSSDAGGPTVPDAGMMMMLQMCPDVEAAVFRPTCGEYGCHDPMTRQNGLDLASPGIADRIRFNVSTCNGLPLRQLIPNKLSPMPLCGARMPLGGALPQDLIDCVQRYIDAL
jgi:hypothetical protein